MRATLLAVVLAGLAACGGDGAQPRHRLLIVGWDGASFRMLDPLVEAGRLPNVARLLARGTSAVLESTIVPISSAAWTAAVTGKGPGETGVYSFFEPVAGTYDVRLVSSRSNQADPIWRILTRRGLRSIVFGVPLTYPPEPLLGTMVAGMLSPFRADYAWPPGYADELRQRGFEPDLDLWIEARPVDLSDVDRQFAIKREVLLELLARDDWDFAMLVFKSLDVVSHGVDETADFATHVAPFYERLDATLGELLDEVGSDTNVLLVSDHGFHVFSAGLNLHAWLLEQGFATRRTKVKRFGIPLDEPIGRRERQMIHQLRNELDWSRTRAFVTRCEGNFGGLRINVAGREPEGIVPPEELEATLAEIEAALVTLTLHPGGPPLVRRVLRGAELYPGPERDVIPDLLFELAPDCQVFANAAFRGVIGEYGFPVPDHELDGILVAAGPSIARRASRDRASILDVAPTALHLLGQPVYAEMSGTVRTELLRGLAPPRVIAEADDPTRDAPGGVDAPFTPAELEELEERLRALGYGE